MTITAEEKYLLNNKAGRVANKVQLGTLIENAESVAASEIALAEGKVLVGNASGVATATEMTEGKILVGSAASKAVAVAVSGDISLAASGAVAIAAGAIVNADVNASAAIDYSKMATMTGDVTMTANASAIGAGKVTVAMHHEAAMKELTGTLTQANLLAISTPVEAIPAPGAGKVIVVDEVELFHSYSTTQYATGSDLALEYATSGDNIALVVDSFVTEAASSSKIIKPSTYDLDGSTGSAAGFDVTANANKAVNFQASNFTNGHASNVVKWRIRYHVVTLLT